MAAREATATIIVRLDLPQLVGRSDAVFLGKAIRVESRWTPDRRHIVTDTTFDVELSVKGAAQPGGTITVRSLGGSVGGIGMRVSGMPVFKKGERALLFTELRRSQRYVVGMKQGIYRVLADPAGQPTVRTELRGLTLAERSTSGRLKMLGHHSAGKPRLLGDFIKHIRQTIAVCAKETRLCRPE